MPTATKPTGADQRLEGRREGARAERARIHAIVTHPEAAGRAELALHAALRTELSIDEAVTILRMAPKTSGSTGHVSTLAALMSQQGSTGVGFAHEAPEPTAEVTTLGAAAIYARRDADEAAARAKAAAVTPAA
jgi:hypothetical protein